MRRESHVRFCEGGEVKSLSATRPLNVMPIRAPSALGRRDRRLGCRKASPQGQPPIGMPPDTRWPDGPYGDRSRQDRSVRQIRRKLPSGRSSG